MAIRKIKTRSFPLKKEAIAWAKDQKKSAGMSADVKWETNRTDNPERPWEAVLFRELK